MNNEPKREQLKAFLTIVLKSGAPNLTEEKWEDILQYKEAESIDEQSQYNG